VLSADPAGHAHGFLAEALAAQSRLPGDPHYRAFLAVVRRSRRVGGLGIAQASGHAAEAEPFSGGDRRQRRPAGVNLARAA
jgi:hypothetical protein